MKILVTGSHGMVGKMLVRRLSRLGLDLLLTPTRAELDLLDRQAAHKYMEEHTPNFVFHLAARVGGIQANVGEPTAFLVENLLISTHVIESAYAAGVPRLINLGSSCMYPKDREVLEETDLLTGPLEPTNEGYAIAKIAGALLCRSISSTQDKLSYKTVVPCNLYGEDDHFSPSRSHLIAAAIHKLHTAKETNADEVEIWGDGSARREFMYVGDLIEFLLLAMRKIDDLPDIINVGAGKDCSVDEYYHEIARIIGYKGRFVHNTDKPSGMRRKLMDISNARALGWEPSTPLTDGLLKTYSAFRATTPHV